MLPPPRTPDKRGYSGARSLASLANKYCPVLVISASPSSTKFDSRGLPSPSSTEFGSRGSPSTFGDDDIAFGLIDRVRLKGLAVYLRRRRLRLRPHRQSSARGARRLSSAMTTSPSLSSIEFGSRGSPSTFGVDDFAFALVDRVRLEGLVVYLRR